MTDIRKALDAAIYRIHQHIDAQAEAAIMAMHREASSYRRSLGQRFKAMA